MTNTTVGKKGTPFARQTRTETEPTSTSTTTSTTTNVTKTSDVTASTNAGDAAVQFVPEPSKDVPKPLPPAKRAVLPQLQVREKAAEKVAEKAGEKGTAAVEKQYSDWASKYDVDTASYGWSAPQTLLRTLTSVTQPNSTQRVLDVGVGTGLASVPFLDARAQVTGVDISQEMLDEAKKKHPEFHHLDRFDIDQPLETAGLKPGTFDVVLSSGVLHFSKDLQRTLDELDRALAPGGTLAFTFIPPQDRKFGENTKLNDVAAVKAHLEKLGLDVVHDETFVAYHDKGNANDPVRYALIVAKKPGDALAAKLPASLDRTASVDRARIASLVDKPLVAGPLTTTWVKADDPRIGQQSGAMLSAVKAQLSAGGDVDFAKIPFPTVTADVARQGEAKTDALVVLAHPDDESVYTGGTVAALTKSGKSVSLAVATDGGGGRGGDGADLKAMRTEELAGAMKALGMSGAPSFLGFGDIGKYKDAHRSEPLTAGDTLRAWGFDGLVEKLVKQIRSERPKALLSFDPTRDPNFSLHGHHMAVGAAVAVAQVLAADPNAFPEQIKAGLKPWAVLEHDVVVPNASPGEKERIADVAVDAQAKRTALRAHASQSFSLERSIKDPGTSETWHRLMARDPGEHALTDVASSASSSTANTVALASKEPALAAKLRAGDAAVKKLYHARPIEQIHSETTRRPIARKQIAALIESQMKKLDAGGLSAEQKKNLARLQDESTGVVVTGQQTGVLGGPLYSLFKALGAVNHAAELSEKGVSAVPVFWLASYDSDLKEVQDMKAVGAGDPKALSLGKKIDERPVGDQKLGDGVDKMLGELDAVLRQTGAPHVDEAMTLAKSCFTADTTFAEGFSKLLNALTKRHGLLILDPSAREFAQIARPVLERELFAPTSSKNAIEKANEELGAMGLAPQVHGNTDRLNVFFVDDRGKRVFLQRNEDGSFTTGGSPAQLSADDARKLLDEAPERFTPSALLRPVVEDQVLPTLSYVGGPSEVSYFAQIGGVYDWAGVPMPEVTSRPSFAFAHKKDVAALEETTGLGIDALLGHEAPLALIGRNALPADVRAAYAKLAEARAAVTNAAQQTDTLGTKRDFATLAALNDDVTKQVNRALDDVLAAVKKAGLERCEKGVTFARGKIMQGLEKARADIEKAKTNPGFQPSSGHYGRTGAELGNLDEQAVRTGRQLRPDLVTAFQKLAPAGEPQERVMTLVQLVAEMGTSAADAFLPLADVGKPGRTLVTVE